MPKKKTTNSIIKEPGTIRGVLKRKKIYELKDPEGRDIPVDFVKDHLLVKDNFVREIAEIWIEIYSALRHLKFLLLKGGPKMYDILREKSDVRRDSKGGFTEYDFGKNIKVVVGYNLRYDFNDDLMKQASEYFDNWLAKHGENSMTKAVRKAFQKQSGQYDIKALNKLNDLKEDDPDFIRGMELKNEAQTSTPTKLRTTLEIRNEEGEFTALPLDISSVMPGDINQFVTESTNSDEEYFEMILNPGIDRIIKSSAAE
ncbi:MAG: DUF3164 family protein [Balneola sp.]